MAEENLNTEDQSLPADDLGTTSMDPTLDDPYNLSQGTNQGTTNIENFMPIVGNQPTVNFGDSMSSNFYSARDNGPGFPPYSKETLPQSQEASINAILQGAAQNIAQNVDETDYSKPYAYDGTASGAHRARYLAYGQETFDKIGFNPMVANEDVFNAQTTIVDDFVRMGANSFLPMLGTGFLAGPKSYGQFLGGNFGQDTDMADSYEEYNSIGMSTKGGVGGFVNNLFNSVAYSAGVLLEASLENALIGAIEGATVGAAGGVAGAGAGAIAGSGIGTLAGLLKAGPQAVKALYQMAKYGGKMSSQLKNLKKFTAAKEAFVNAGKATHNFINPLAHTVTAIKRNVLTNADNLSNLARAGRTAATFFREANMLNAGISEGRLEGGFVENNTYTRGYDEFVKRNNRPPTSEEQLDLRKMAKEAGFRATWKNALLVNYSNKLAFPNMFKGSFIKGAAARTLGKVNDKYIMNYVKPKKGLAKGVYEVEEYSRKNALKGLLKPANLGKASVDYFKVNVVEGAQETLQDVIAKSTEDYYIETYFDKAKENFDFSMASLNSAFGEQFGAEGFETFLSGFFMGGLLRPISNVQPFLQSRYLKYTLGKEGYEDYVKIRKNQATKVKDAMNRSNDPIEVLNSRMVNYGNQSIITKANSKNGISTKEAKDNVTTSLVSDLITVMDAGFYNQWLSNFKNYDQLNPKQMEEAFDLEEGQGDKAKVRLTKFLKRAERIKSRDTFAKKMLADKKVDLTNLRKGTPQYEKAALFNLAVDRAKWNLVFFQESFDDALERINGINDKLNNSGLFSKLPGANFKNIADPSLLNNEIDMLSTEIEVLKKSQASTPSITQENQIQQKETLLNALTEFRSAQNTWFIDIPQMLKDALTVEGNSEETEKAIEEVNAAFAEGFDPNLDYKNAFENLLEVLSGDSVSFLQEKVTKIGSENFDELFDDLKDFVKLRNETKALVPAVNLLLDPDGFAQHVDRNFAWMRNLYLTREEYYKKAINDSIEMKEYSDLLWSLSQDNIYIDLNEFSKWILDKENYIPKEFIDVSEGQERIIPQGSMLFDKYYQQFRTVAIMQREKPAGEESELNEQRDKAIETLLKQKDEALADARLSYTKDFKDETGEDLEDVEGREAFEPMDPKKIKLQQARVLLLEKEIKALSSLINAQPANIEAIDDKIADLMRFKVVDVVYNQEYENIILPEFENKINNDPELEAEIQAFVNSVSYSNREYVSQVAVDAFAFIDTMTTEGIEITEYLEEQAELANQTPLNPKDTQSYVDYQKALSEIELEYEGLIAEVNKTFRDKGLVETDVKQVVKTTDNWDTIPQELKDELQPLFDQRINDPELINTDPIEYERKRQAWFAEQFDAVNKFNDAKNTERLKAEKEATTISEPKLKFKKESGLLDKKISEIEDIINLYNVYLTQGAKPKGRLGSVALTKKDISDLKNDIKELETLIDKKRRNLSEISDYVDSITLFKERILDREGEVEQVTDEEGNLVRRLDGKDARRVTKIASEIDGREFRYSKLDTILGYVDLAKEDGVKDSVSEFMKSLRSLSLAQFRNNDKLIAVEEALREGQVTENGVIKQQPNFTKEAVEKIISEQAYIERSEGGNSIDAAAKDFFTREGVGFKVPEKPDNISKEAFDQLFGKRGIITKFRDRMIDGEFQIIGSSNILFDKQLGIAGETDLIAVNPEGEFMIIDLKALTNNSWRNYNIGREKAVLIQKLRDQGLTETEILEDESVKEINDKYSQRNYFRYQQSLYRNLFYRMTGKIPRMALLPVEVKYDNNTGQIVSAKRPAILAKNADLIQIDYAAEASLYVPEQSPEVEIRDGREVIVEGIKDDELYLVEEYTKSNKVSDNLYKKVVYEGKVGTIVETREGTYAVEFRDPGSNELYTLDILDGVSELKDGSANLNTLSIAKIRSIKNLGQVSTVDGEVINAEFTDKSQSEARINGYLATVNRNKEGLIVSLTYRSNDGAIADVRDRQTDINNAIDKLTRSRKAAKTTAEKNTITNQIADLQLEYNRESGLLTELQKTNSKRTVRGGNASSMIFALNRLPSRFSSEEQSKKGRTQEKEIEDIKRLATISDVMFDAVATIMSRQYPEKLDQLIEKGPGKLTQKDYFSIVQWAEVTDIELLQLESQVKNKGEVVTYIQGVRKQVRDLLNDLTLIKLTKDGKIKRDQSEARKVFGTKAEVPFRFDISNVQRTDGGSTERVPGSKRQPTTAERKQVNKEILNIQQESKSEKDSKAQEILLEKVNKLTTQNFEIESANILIQAENNKSINSITVQKALVAKRELLDSELNNPQQGDNVIASDGKVMRITKAFKNGSFNLENIHDKKDKMKVTTEELMENFKAVSENSEAFSSKAIEVTEEQKSDLNEAKSSLEEISEEEFKQIVSNKDDDKKSRRERLKNRSCKN
ncbi:MAG: hypothetical protein ACYSW3_04490 [Planctomycetota bacterium]|jgi:hypothetical protein